MPIRQNKNPSKDIIMGQFSFASFDSFVSKSPYWQDKMGMPVANMGFLESILNNNKVRIRDGIRPRGRDLPDNGDVLISP